MILSLRYADSSAALLNAKISLKREQEVGQNESFVSGVRLPSPCVIVMRCGIGAKR